MTLPPERVHARRHNFARRPNILSQECMGEWHHLHTPVFGIVPQPPGKAQQRPSQAPGDIVYRKTLDTQPVIGCALCQNLEQPDCELWMAREDYVFYLIDGPRHNF